jgi:hypothetical protein
MRPHKNTMVNMGKNSMDYMGIIWDYIWHRDYMGIICSRSIGISGS